MAATSNGPAKKPGRTASGAPNAAARAKTGTGSRESFPVFDRKSGEDALQARGRGKDMTPDQVINKVSRYANKTDDASLKKKVAEARANERAKKSK